MTHAVCGSTQQPRSDPSKAGAQAGLAAARARGRNGGRPRGSVRYDPKKLALAQQLYAEQKRSVAEICKTLSIARTTFYRYLERHQDELAGSQQNSAS